MELTDVGALVKPWQDQADRQKESQKNTNSFTRERTAGRERNQCDHELQIIKNNN